MTTTTTTATDPAAHPAPAPDVRPAAIRAEGLSLGYAGEPVVEDVDLDVSPGEILVVLGHSGCGKSTLLRAFAGLLRPLAGRIVADGADVAGPAAERALVFQDDALLPWRTARQNVALGLRLRGLAAAEALAEADGWLDRLGLAGCEGRYPRQLSGGQRKRVALAQVLALKPRLLLMDEPFASLDAIVRHHVTEDLLAWVERERIAVLLVTHDLEEAQAISDVVYLLSRGPRARIAGRYPVAIPRPRDLIAARGHPSFAPLLKRIWDDLSTEVGPLGGGG
jgi:NitT/TauT family transport system ATP-binding protein